MNLEQYQGAVARLCTAREVPEEDVAALGGEAGKWRLYRRMVRRRIRRTLIESMPRLSAHLGEAPFAGKVDDFLASRPPRSRYIRDLVLEFDDFLADEPRADTNEDDASRELSRWERTVWEVRDRDVRVPTGVTEFDFERIPLVNPCRERLVCTYSVWDRSSPPRRLDRAQTVIVVRGVDDRVAHCLVDAWEVSVLDAWAAGDAVASEGVRQAAAAHGVTLDADRLGRLCGALASWIDRSLVLGTAGA